MEARPRLAIKAKNIDLNTACTKLWHAILEESQPPSPIDLSIFEHTAPWNISQEDYDLCKIAIALKKQAEESESMLHSGMTKIYTKLNDFTFLSTDKYLERVLNIINVEIDRLEKSQKGIHENQIMEKLRDRMESEEDKNGKAFGAFFAMTLVDAQERNLLDHCRTAAELIKSGIDNAQPEDLEKIRTRMDEMFRQG